MNDPAPSASLLPNGAQIALGPVRWGLNDSHCPHEGSPLTFCADDRNHSPSPVGDITWCQGD